MWQTSDLPLLLAIRHLNLTCGRLSMQLSLARAPGVAFTVFSCLTGAAAVAAASLLRGSPDPGTGGAGVAVQASQEDFQEVLNVFSNCS